MNEILIIISDTTLKHGTRAKDCAESCTKNAQKLMKISTSNNEGVGNF